MLQVSSRALVFSALVFSLFGGSGSIRAADPVPGIINYQGRVQANGSDFSGTGQFKFALVNGNGSVTYWSNDGSGSGGGPPGSAVSLSVSNGLFAVLLGDSTIANMSAIPSSVFANGDVRLRIWFNDGTNGLQQLSPDQRIAATGYAMLASTVENGAITASHLADNSVTTLKLSNGAVTTLKLANGAVSNAALADSAVTAAKISDGTITGAKLAATTVTAGNLADGAITATKLASHAVTSLDAPGAGPTGAVTVDGAGKVGIGTPTPGASLHVNGNIKLQTTTRYYSLDYSAFRLANGEWNTNYQQLHMLNGYAHIEFPNSVGSTPMLAPVFLPHGAAITGFSVSITGTGITTTLRANSTVLGTVTDTGSATISHQVDNQNNSYRIESSYTAKGTNGVNRVMITYTVNEPLP